MHLRGPAQAEATLTAMPSRPLQKRSSKSRYMWTGIMIV